MLPWAKKKGTEVWDFTGEEDDSQGEGKNKCLVTKYLSCYVEKSFLCKTKLSLVIALFLVHTPYLPKLFWAIKGEVKRIIS